METSKDQLEVVHVQCQLQYEIFLLLFYSLLLRMTDKLSSIKSRENLTIIRPHQDPSFSDSDQAVATRRSKIIDKFDRPNTNVGVPEMKEKTSLSSWHHFCPFIMTRINSEILFLIIRHQFFLFRRKIPETIVGLNSVNMTFVIFQ